MNNKYISQDNSVLSNPEFDINSIDNNEIVMQNLENRINKLERSTNNWFKLSGALLVIIICSSVFAFKPGIEELIQTKQIAILSQIGDNSVVLKSDDNSGGEINVASSFDNKLNIATISQTKTNGGSLSICNDAGISLTNFAAGQDGGVMRVNSAKGNPVCVFTSSNLGNGIINMFDASGTHIWDGPPKVATPPPVTEAPTDVTVKKGKSKKAKAKKAKK